MMKQKLKWHILGCTQILPNQDATTLSINDEHFVSYWLVYHKVRIRSIIIGIFILILNIAYVDRSGAIAAGLG